MRIAYNPQSEGAITTLPSGYENDIVFDLSGLAIYAKGVKFKGTDTTYNVFKKHASGDTGGNNGLVPVPNYNNGSKTRYLREDGTWVVPTNTNNYRPISVGGTSILGNNNTALNLVAGSFIRLDAEQSSGNYTGKVTIHATYSNVTQEADGLMSAADKKKLDGLNFTGDFNGTLENAFTKVVVGTTELKSTVNPTLTFV